MISIARTSALRTLRGPVCARPPSSPPQSSRLARLLSTLAVLEQRDGKLNSSSLGAVTAGQKLGGSITGFVAGSNVKPIAEEASKVKGMEKVIMVENGAYDRVQVFCSGQVVFTGSAG